MAKYLYLIFIVLPILFSPSCDLGGDYSAELSGEYFYRSEGPGMHDIHFTAGKQIPADVLGYDYDDNFIIALQKPDAVDEPLYETKYSYPQGRDRTYYWLIVHSQKLILGPMLEQEFVDARIKYHVPSTLDVKNYPD